jgi:hypothetical protein
MTYDYIGSRARFFARSRGELTMTMLRMKAVIAGFAAASVLTMSAGNADAFWGHRQGATTAYALPSVPVTAAYFPAPVVVARPVVAAAPIVTAGYAPVTSYYAPATTAYYAPAASYSAPVTSYYAPAATTYAAPVTSYYAPAATTYAAPVTSYYAPAATTYAAPVTSYYAPAAYVAPTTTYYAPAAVIRGGVFGPRVIVP